MSDQPADDLAPRGWRNYTRSKRARELRTDLAQADEDLEVTDWYLDPTNDEGPERCNAEASTP